MAEQDASTHCEAYRSAEPGHTTDSMLMALPTEIRYKIYCEVFGTQLYPLLLSGRRQVSSIFGRSEPTLNISLFRVNR